MFSAKQQFLRTEQIMNKYGDVIHFTLLGSDAATAANYVTLPFIAPHPIEIVKVKVAFTTASTSGTLQLEQLSDGTAPGSGNNILNSTISLSGTANTVVSVTGRDMNSYRVLKENERIGLVDGGTLTNLTDLIVSVYYKPKGRGDYR